jgi:hypothetical protein
MLRSSIVSIGLRSYITDDTVLPVIKSSHINAGLHAKWLSLYSRTCTKCDATVAVALSHAQRHRAERYNVTASNRRFSQLRAVVAWTRLRARRYGARIPVGARDFPLLPNFKTGPSTLLFSGYLGSFPWVMRPRCEVNHSPPSSAEAKNEWSYTSILRYMPSCRGQRKP